MTVDGGDEGDATGRVARRVHDTQLDGPDRHHRVVTQRRERGGLQANLARGRVQLDLVHVRWHRERVRKVAQAGEHEARAHWHMAGMADVVVVEVGRDCSRHVAADGFGGRHDAFWVVARIDYHTLTRDAVAHQVHKILHRFRHSKHLALRRPSGLLGPGDITAREELVKEKALVTERVGVVR